MAGRKNKYTVDYFPHYCKGLESKTMFILENKFGLVGYAIWYKTLELLGKSEMHFIDLRDDTDLLFLISKLGVSEDKFNEIYGLLSKLGAIDSDLWSSRIVFSDNFVSNIEDAYVRRKGINVLHKYDICNHLSIKYKQKVPKKSKVKKSKEERDIPDISVFMIYLKEDYLKSDPNRYEFVRQRMIDTYNAWKLNGWKDGNDKVIINWKVKAINQLRYIK